MIVPEELEVMDGKKRRKKKKGEERGSGPGDDVAGDAEPAWSLARADVRRARRSRLRETAWAKARGSLNFGQSGGIEVREPWR